MKKLLKVVPIFKDYIWGGSELKKQFVFEADIDNIAEVWLLAGDSEISNKLYDSNLNLYTFIQKYGIDFMGEKFSNLTDFPILIKIIGAKQNLSIQVHPDDEYAQKKGQPFGKTEMWHVLDTRENNSIVYGPKTEITEDQLIESINNKTIESLLLHPTIKKGDNVFLSAGTIHAIKADTIVFEVQQQSNTTYRLYDFERVDMNGKSRDLHINESLAVSDLSPIAVNFDRATVTLGEYKATILERCNYFTVTKFEIDNEVDFSVDNKSFASIIFLEGDGDITHMGVKYPFKKGESFLLAAGSDKCCIRGKSTFAVTTM